MSLVNVGDLVRYRRAIPRDAPEGFDWVEETGVVVESHQTLVDNQVSYSHSFSRRNKTRTVTSTIRSYGKVIG